MWIAIKYKIIILTPPQFFILMWPKNKCKKTSCLHTVMVMNWSVNTVKTEHTSVFPVKKGPSICMIHNACWVCLEGGGGHNNNESGACSNDMHSYRSALHSDGEVVYVGIDIQT